MCTAIFRAAALLFAGFALAACEGGIAVSRAAPERILVADDSVVVAGPPGYCIDRTASRETAGSAFVLLGSCASLSGGAEAPAPRVPGLLTVAVSGDVGDGAPLDSLGPFFRSEPGRAVLSRTGDPDSVRILDIRPQDGALFIHARDTASGPLPQIADEYWRAFLDVNGRLVTVSVTGFDARPMSKDTGLATLEALADRLRLENGGTAPAAG